MLRAFSLNFEAFASEFKKMNVSWQCSAYSSRMISTEATHSDTITIHVPRHNGVFTIYQ